MLPWLELNQLPGFYKNPTLTVELHGNIKTYKQYSFKALYGFRSFCTCMFFCVWLHRDSNPNEHNARRIFLLLYVTIAILNFLQFHQSLGIRESTDYNCHKFRCCSLDYVTTILKNVGYRYIVSTHLSMF